MKLVTYNIHYAVGRDGREDVTRIAEAVRGADVIALQEVERNYGPGEPPDQPAALEALLPEYYWVYKPVFDVDASEAVVDGRVLNRRRQHGVRFQARLHDSVGWLECPQAPPARGRAWGRAP